MSSKATRPLSPHIQVYRPQITSVLSILHRTTGIVIALGSLLLSWWLLAIMIGGESYQSTYKMLNSTPGRGLLVLWTGCTFYHLLNGIRHLIWDMGFGFEIIQIYTTGKIVVVSTAICTLLAWLI